MLKILYSNVQSIQSKILELEAVALDLKPDLILLCETWCNNNIDNAALQLSGYDLNPELRCDRADTANGIGGGLLVYSRTGLEILPCDTDVDFTQYCKFVVKGTVSRKKLLR